MIRRRPIARMAVARRPWWDPRPWLVGIWPTAGEAAQAQSRSGPSPRAGTAIRSGPRGGRARIRSSS